MPTSDVFASCFACFSMTVGSLGGLEQALIIEDFQKRVCRAGHVAHTWRQSSGCGILLDRISEGSVINLSGQHQKG
jgi:hypothetical protein